MLDPWSTGGVLDDSNFGSSVISLKIEKGAHHSDLMFSNEEDHRSVRLAREKELEIISEWIENANKKKKLPKVSLVDIL